MDNGRAAMPTGRADPCATIGIEVPVTALRKHDSIVLKGFMQMTPGFRCNASHPAQGRQRSSRRSSAETARSRISAHAVNRITPARTASMSNTPSACRIR